MPAPNRNTTQNSNVTVFSTDVYPSQGVVGPRSGPSVVGTTRTYLDFYAVSSVREPGFRRTPRHLLPWHPYSKIVRLYRDPISPYTQWAYSAFGGGNYAIHEYFTNAAWLGVSSDPADHADAIPDFPTQKVVSKLIEQCKLNQAQLGVAAAEFGKTMSHVSHTVERITKAIMALRKGRFGDFTSALGVTASRRQTDRFYTGLRKYYGRSGEGFRYNARFKVPRSYQEARFRDFMAQTWLEYTYGWKPLLQDIYDHAKATAKVFTDHSGHWRTAKAGSKVEKVTNKTSRPTTHQYYGEWKIKVERYEQMVINYCIPTGVVNPAIAFGLNNPAVIAWEVVPFSFVVDWFIPIGTALENLTAFQGLSLLKGADMRRTVYHNQARVLPNGNRSQQGNVSYECKLSECRGEYQWFEMTRTLMPTFPSFGWPKLKDPRSFAHAASAIALLQSLFLSGDSRKLKLR